MKLRKYIVFFVIVIVVLSVCRWCVYNVVYPYKYKSVIEKYSVKYDLDPLLVLSVIRAESNFNSNAHSFKDAHGLMQVTDSTAKWAAKEMNISYSDSSELLDPDYNINMGCWYLKNLRDEFKNMDLVIAAYNGGRGNVNKWLSDSKYSGDGKTLKYIPFKETDKYLKKVKVNYNIYKFLYK
ncbi:lytic transglycosylase domain-containing protein [Clostridium sp. C8-1-8]|uniref:lytic transglycosylase domain-containing protein n=1 Tax=Clostridium sp. C8-1-8 TaxID=2698831 RepID=UPI001368B0A9|nr:lytic transglycosylase domain-containing protein [Clostridium sp. C8-1-8]